MEEKYHNIIIFSLVVCEKKLIKNQIKKCRKLATQAFIRADSKKSINRAKLARLTGKGSLQRIERGTYRRDGEPSCTESDRLSAFGSAVPRFNDADSV